MHRIRWSFVAAPLAVATLFAACGGSAKNPPTPAASPAEPSTAIAAGPSPTVSADAATAIAAGPAVDLVDYKDPSGRFTVQLPRGWPLEQGPNRVTAASPGDGPITNIGIYCQPGATVKDLQEQDSRVISNVGSRNVTSTSSTTVAGTTALILGSTTTLSAQLFRHTTAYFEGGGCAWRAQVTTVTDTDYTALFNRVLASFRLP